MPRRPSFRRDTELQNEIRRINKLVQNKQSRIRLQNDGLETVGVDTVKFKEFSSRKDIERYQRQMEKFLDRKAEVTVINQQGTQLSYSEVKEVQKEISKINKGRAKQWDALKDLKFKHRGTDTGNTVAQQADPDRGMGDIRFSEMKPKSFNVNRFASKKQWEQYRQDVLGMGGADEIRRHNELLRENYLLAIHRNLGWEGRDIFSRVSNMPLDEFIKTFYTENNAGISFIYDKLEIQARVNELKNIWV